MDPQQSPRPATQNGLFQPASHLASACTPRTVFGNEAALEHRIKHDTHVHAFLADYLATDIATIANQVVIYNPDRRADLVLNRNNPNDKTIVIELQLDPLDTDHLMRGIIYAATLNATEVVYIAPSMEPNTQHTFNKLRAWLSGTSATANLHFIRLTATQVHPDLGGTFTLDPATPPLPKPGPNRKTLQAIQAYATALGDTTLADVTPDRDRRLDVYKGLKHLRIRLAVSTDDVTITISSGDATAHRPYRSSINALTHHLATELQQHHLTNYRHNTSSTVLATYTFPTPQQPDGTTDTNLTEHIARAYITTRERLLHTLANHDTTDPNDDPTAAITYQPTHTN